VNAIVLVRPPYDPAVAGPFFGHLLGDGWSVRAYQTQEEVPDDVAARAEVILAPLAPVDASLIKRCPNLRLIQVPGHGYENVSVEDARAAGVPVATIASSGAEAHTVAEWTILTAGAASRRLIHGHAKLAAGEFDNLGVMQAGTFELARKTIGIVGFGRIGREVAKRARGFDMAVVYHDAVRAPRDVEESLGASYRDLDALLAESDFVTLHVPALPATDGLIGAREFDLMKRDAVLINTSRGRVVDHGALVAALSSKRIRAAAIDVFDPEPPAPDDPLLALDNVVLSPHMAGVTAESLLRILMAATENCARLARGEPLRDVVTE
jgi:phosphoglycerate dehydrogenase-like enzyme